MVGYTMLHYATVLLITARLKRRKKNDHHMKHRPHEASKPGSWWGGGLGDVSAEQKPTQRDVLHARSMTNDDDTRYLLLHALFLQG